MSTPKLHKISMNITEKDLDNVDYLLSKLNERSKASVVSKSLSLTREFLDIIDDKSKIIIENEKGERKEIKIIGL